MIMTEIFLWLQSKPMIMFLPKIKNKFKVFRKGFWKWSSRWAEKDGVKEKDGIKEKISSGRWSKERNILI